MVFDGIIMDPLHSIKVRTKYSMGYFFDIQLIYYIDMPTKHRKMLAIYGLYFNFSTLYRDTILIIKHFQIPRSSLIKIFLSRQNYLTNPKNISYFPIEISRKTDKILF